MSTHKIVFYEDLTKIIFVIFKYHQIGTLSLLQDLIHFLLHSKENQALMGESLNLPFKVSFKFSDNL